MQAWQKGANLAEGCKPGRRVQTWQKGANLAEGCRPGRRVQKVQRVGIPLARLHLLCESQMGIPVETTDRSGDRVSILLVDDLPDKLLVLRTILEGLDLDIIAARSGEDALRLVLKQEFAVILLDINLPGMDGLETAAYIRGRKKSAHTPIIFITAYHDDEQFRQGYSLGAVDYIFTPVVPEVLRSKVKVLVDLYRMTQQARRHADERVALAREQAARAAAEETSRRLAF